MNPASITAGVTFKNELIELKVVSNKTTQIHIAYAWHFKVCCLAFTMLAFL
jgi:hypothetical protein